MGITGADLILERCCRRDRTNATRSGSCRLAVCGSGFQSCEIQPWSWTVNGLRTSFPTVTDGYLAKHGAKAHLVTLSGSVEIMIGLGVADAIVDLVETGSTLAANQLRILDEIGSYETVLIQNREKRQSELADRVVRRLKVS